MHEFKTAEFRGEAGTRTIFLRVGTVFTGIIIVSQLLLASLYTMYQIAPSPALDVLHHRHGDAILGKE